ncbi:major facilitator superfamily domain-containing protein [Geranomyces variabilis]|nr:major facilitator superfamily domain-containing protein [Geranomyces variabilis]KAJ3140961.1 hypothetical protein HDU90_006982 [Geranomyces variabilis]
MPRSSSQSRHQQTRTPAIVVRAPSGANNLGPGALAGSPPSVANHNWTTASRHSPSPTPHDGEYDEHHEDGDASPASRPPSYATLVSPSSREHVLLNAGDERQNRPRKGWRDRLPRRWKPTMPDRDTAVVLFAQLVTEASRGIVLPTMYPYVQVIGGNATTYGTMISLFSVGRLVLSVPFGEWADRRMSSREVLVFAAVLGAASNLLYSFAWAMPHPIVWLYISRLCCGFSTGTIAVFRAYLASSSAPADRTRVIAWSGMAQYAGFSLTPIISTLIILIRDVLAPLSSVPGDDGGGVPGNATTLTAAGRLWSSLAIQDNNPDEDIPPPVGTPSIAALILPTIFLVVVNLLTVPLLFAFMPKKDPIADPARTPSPLPPPSPAMQSAARADAASEAKLIKFGFVLFFCLNLVLRGVLGVTETIAPEMYEHHKSDDDAALEQSGQFFFYLGLAGMVVFLLVDPIQKRVMAGHNLLILAILTVVAGTVLNINPTPARNPFTWACFVGGMTLIWSIGSPICQTLTVSMFSKMLGSRPQGSLIGWITTAGSIGRIVFPALVSISNRAAVWVNCMDIGLCLACVVGILAFGRWIKKTRAKDFHPLLPPPEMDAEENCDEETDDDDDLLGDTDNELGPLLGSR